MVVTDKSNLNSRGICERLNTIVFEADTARSWICELSKQAQRAIDAAEADSNFLEGNKIELEELREAKLALIRAKANLRLFEGMVSRRENDSE